MKQNTLGFVWVFLIHGVCKKQSVRLKDNVSIVLSFMKSLSLMLCKYIHPWNEKPKNKYSIQKKLKIWKKQNITKI